MDQYKIFFSPTGGTKKVIDILANAAVSQTTDIDLSSQDFSPKDLSKDSLVWIAMPSFGGRVPKIAIDRFKKIKGNGAKAVVVAVYGNREQEDTLIEMADAAKEAGLHVIAGIAAIAEHSIIREIAKGRPDATDVIQLQEFAQEIKKVFQEPGRQTPFIPGNRPYQESDVGEPPKATKDCMECGLCAKKCPTGAISHFNVKMVDASLCANCMRCVAICPKNARVLEADRITRIRTYLQESCIARKENQLFII